VARARGVRQSRALDGPPALLHADPYARESNGDRGRDEIGGGSIFGVREDPAARGPRERPVLGSRPASRRCAAPGREAEAEQALGS
jgi:hypothetical protein